jgi:hypothetical protein
MLHTFLKTLYTLMPAMPVQLVGKPANLKEEILSLTLPKRPKRHAVACINLGLISSSSDTGPRFRSVITVSLFGFCMDQR